jgi:hypothetical protein
MFMTDAVEAPCLRNLCCSADAVLTNPKTTIHPQCPWDSGPVLPVEFLLTVVKYLQMG